MFLQKKVFICCECIVMSCLLFHNLLGVVFLISVSGPPEPGYDVPSVPALSEALKEASIYSTLASNFFCTLSSKEVYTLTNLGRVSTESLRYSVLQELGGCNCIPSKGFVVKIDQI